MKSIPDLFDRLMNGSPAQSGEAAGTLTVYALIGFAIVMLIRKDLKNRKEKAKAKESEKEKALQEVIEKDEVDALK